MTLQVPYEQELCSQTSSMGIIGLGDSLYYDVTNPSTMPSLTPLLCRHLPLYYDVTNDVTNISIMTSLGFVRHYPLYYDVTIPSTIPSTMTSLTPLL